jgi:hypothetical protein
MLLEIYATVSEAAEAISMPEVRAALSCECSSYTPPALCDVCAARHHLNLARHHLAKVIEKTGIEIPGQAPAAVEKKAAAL